MKKLLTGVVASCLVTSMLCGCVSSGGSDKGTSQTENGELTPVQMVMYGDMSPRMAELLENEIYDKVAEEINVALKVKYLPWSEYAGGKSELMMSAGEKFFSYTNPDVTAKMVAKGYYADITNVYEENAKELIENCGGLEAFDAFKIKGKQYGIPVGYKPASGEDYVVMVRSDVMEEVGVEDITSVEDLENFYKLAKEKHPDYVGQCRGINPLMLNAAIPSEKNIILMNGFAMTDGNAIDDPTVYSYYESEEYKQYCEITGRWNKMGIIPSYELSNGAQSTAEFNAGRGLFSAGSNDRIFEFNESVRNSVPDALFKNYYLGDKTKKPLMDRGSYTVAFAISAGVEDEEELAAYIQTINLFQKNQEWVDLWTYGIEETDYTLTEDGRVERINTDEIMHNWMTVNTKFRRYPTYIDDETIETFNNWNEGTIPQKNTNFVFDLEPVKAEYAQLQAVETEFLLPISTGFKDYDENIDEAIKRLKDAGLDKFMAEMQSQFDEFMKNKAK